MRVRNVFDEQLSLQFQISDQVSVTNNYTMKKYMYIFRLHNGTCGLLVTQPGIEPAPPALEGQSLKYWTTREVSSKKKYFWGDYRRQIAGNQR